MGRRALGVVAVVLMLTVGVTACGRSGSTVALRDEKTASVAWRPCNAIECGSLSVPLDFRRPSGPQITLALARLPARKKAIGVLFTNPGGPGGSGLDLLRESANVFPAEIRDSFDLISWDPRGVGASAPVHCLGSLDAFYAVDRSPQSAAEVARIVAASQAFAAGCRKNSAAILPYLSTAASARDMDAIRAAIGAPQISYVGFSYGTFLGAVYADLFPAHVRTMVLDGAIDPALSYADTSIDQAKSFEADLAAFFADCAARSSCAFAHGTDPAMAYDDLARAITAEPIPGVVDGEHRTLGPGELDLGVASALYSGAAGYKSLASALAQAARGAGDQMLALSDAYTGRRRNGAYSNETDAFYATGCIDAPAPATASAAAALAARAAKVAPHFGASTVWLGLPCTYWPVAAQGKAAPVYAPGAPPIVVVGALHDPATPYTWAQSLAKELRSGRLVTASGNSHTSYGRGDQCVDDAVDTYLLKLQAPAAGAQCP
jgi:pimeloyl-ACP methyl ester carboxylesterase